MHRQVSKSGAYSATPFIRELATHATLSEHHHVSILKTRESKTHKHKCLSSISFKSPKSMRTYPDEMILWPHGVRSLNSHYKSEWRQVTWIINNAPIANLDTIL